MIKMRKVNPIIIFLFVLVLSGCNSDEKRLGHVNPTLISEDSKDLLNAIDVSANIFDVKWNTEKKLELEYFIDFYEDGKFKSYIIEGGDVINHSEVSKKSSIYFSIKNLKDQDKQEWRITHKQKAYSISNNEIVNIENTFTELRLTPKQDIISGNDVILAVILKDKERTLGINDKVFDSNEQALSELINNHQYVYVLRMKVTSDINDQ
jgi:hypothetical protein